MQMKIQRKKLKLSKPVGPLLVADFHSTKSLTIRKID